MDSKKSTLKKVLRVSAFIIISVFIILFVIGTVHLNSVEKTQKAVEKIRNTKLTLDDVMGKNLPPDPGAEADKTIQGIDANKNGIRDDVELAIFKEYPNSAKTRAVLLQYALALQMETTQSFLNKEIAGEIANKEDRAIFCSSENMTISGEGAVIEAIQKYGKFMYNIQFNKEEREKKHKEFYSYVKGGRIDEVVNCDIELPKLPN